MGDEVTAVLGGLRKMLCVGCMFARTCIALEARLECSSSVLLLGAWCRWNRKDLGEHDLTDVLWRSRILDFAPDAVRCDQADCSCPIQVKKPLDQLVVFAAVFVQRVSVD